MTTHKAPRVRRQWRMSLDAREFLSIAAPLAGVEALAVGLLLGPHGIADVVHMLWTLI